MSLAPLRFRLGGVRAARAPADGRREGAAPAQVGRGGAKAAASERGRRFRVRIEGRTRPDGRGSHMIGAVAGIRNDRLEI